MNSIAATEQCQLLLIGAGYSAVSALTAAYDYLKPGDKVVVVERRADWGGMWRDQYSFLHLHQPAKHFTTGSFSWNATKDGTQLASKDEVLDHFADVVKRVSKKLDVKCLWAHDYEGRVEEADGVVATLNNLANGQAVQVFAEKVIRATGLNVKIKKPLAVSSDLVSSVSVGDDLLSRPELFREPRPIYIIGSGKTAYDLTGHLAKQHEKYGTSPKITMVAGRGVYFWKREKFFGSKTMTQGTLVTDFCLDFIRGFNGENCEELLKEQEERGMLHSAVTGAGVFRFGVLSEHECATVKRSVSRVIKGRMADAIDTPAGPVLVMASGERVPIEAGALLVNCTDSIRTPPNTPLLSAGGRVLTTQVVLTFPGPSAYYLAHLFYLGRLAAVAPRLHFVRMGGADVNGAQEDTSAGVSRVPAGLEARLCSAFLANLLRILPALPPSVVLKDKSNLNTWYPPHRQAAAAVRLLARRGALLALAAEVTPERYVSAITHAPRQNPTLDYLPLRRLLEQQAGRTLRPSEKQELVAALKSEERTRS